MFRKDPPYDKAIKLSLIVLVILWMVRRISPEFLPEWLVGFMTGFSIVALLSSLAAAYKGYQDYRAGHLFPLRTISFYMTGFTVFLAAIFLVYDMAAGTGEVAEGLFVLAFLAGIYSQSMPYFYLDSIRMEHRLGFTTTVLPVFSVAKVREEEDVLYIVGSEGEEIGLFRGQIFPGRWPLLCTRVRALSD